MAKKDDRSEQKKQPREQEHQEAQQERGFGRAPGQADPAQGGTGERQQGGGGQSYQTDKPGQRAGRQRNGGQDSH